MKIDTSEFFDPTHLTPEELEEIKRMAIAKESGVDAIEDDPIARGLVNAYIIKTIGDTIEEPSYSLNDVRDKFGALLAEIGGCNFQPRYRETGDKVLIRTLSEGIRGPKIDRASSVNREGTAFIDFAITPDHAKRLHKLLGDAIKESQQK